MSATAYRAGLMACHTCGKLARPAPGAHEGWCPRCGASMHFRKPNSIARTWALLIASVILYIPANVLPVMESSSIVGSQTDTIMSGVVYLWVSGSWPLAIVVFVASVVVPLAKIIALAFLNTSVQMRSKWQPLQRSPVCRA